jgi:hypothetical protein
MIMTPRTDHILDGSMAPNKIIINHAAGGQVEPAGTHATVRDLYVERV